MKRIGLVGGMTPESTILYYDTIIGLGRKTQQSTLDNPVVIIYSINLSEIARFEGIGEPEKVIDLLAGVFDALHRAGAEIGALTANTPHVYFDEIAERAPMPLVSILQSTVDETRRMGCHRPLLLGTNTTMGSDMYPERFRAGGIEIVIPDEEERQLINRPIYEELSVGEVREETRQQYLQICRRHIERNRVDSVILGCTEIPLVLKDGDLPVPLIDTARVHAAAIFSAAGS